MNGIEIDFPAVFWLLVAVQMLGVASACLVRVCENSHCLAFFQWSFFACLVLVGLSTGVALLIGPGVWLACAASLAAMVLTATFDLKGAMQGINP